MTREEAIEKLELMRQKVDEETYRALILAIKALEQEPCDDAISREAVDKYIARLLSGYLYDGERERLEIFSAYLWELPSVTPSITRDIEKSNFSQEQYLLDTDTAYQIGYEQGKKDSRRKGRWISDINWKCNNCGFVDSGAHGFNFCPNCGARMESEE